MAVKMMQGDSWPVYIRLMSGDQVITPDLVTELEVCVGESLRYTMTEGTVKFDAETNRWYIWPTQEETLNIEPDGYSVICRPKFRGTPAMVKGIQANMITIIDGHSEEVI